MTRPLKAVAPTPPNGSTNSAFGAVPSLPRRLIALHDRYGFDAYCVGLVGIIGFGLFFVGLYAWVTM